MTSSLLRLAACLLISSVAHAESYQGAPSLLERLQQPAPDEPSATDAQALKPRLEAFKREAAKLEPRAAAKRWLALFEAFASTSDDSESDEEAAELSDLLEALPPSTAWPELEKEIAATKEGRPSARHTALRVLMAALNGSTDVPALVAEVNAEMKRGRGFLNRYSSYEARQVAEAAEALNRRNGRVIDPATAMKELVKNARANQSLELPAGLARSPEAEALVKEALQKGAQLRTDDEATRKLVVRVLQANPDLLKASQWSLIESTEDLALAEQMLQRFPAAKTWERRAAEQIVLTARILQGKHEEALKGMLQGHQPQQTPDATDPEYLDFVLNQGSSAFSLLSSKEFQKAVATHDDPLRKFLETSLKKLPSLPLWDTYVTHLATHGHAKEALAFMESVAREAPEGGHTRRLIDAHLPDALLAAGEMERGVAGLRTRLGAAKQPAAGMNEAERASLSAQLQAAGVEPKPQLIEILSNEGSDSGNASERLSQALKLTKLGRLLKRPEWVEEGLAALGKAVADSDSSYISSEVIDAYFKNGRGPDAEALVATLLERYGKKENSTYQLASAAALLIDVYRRAGRYDDIVVMLDRYKRWSGTDLANLDQSAGDVPLQLAAAEAFFHQDKKDLALAVVQRVLQKRPGEDAAYQLRLALGGADLIAELDRVAALHPFEERPLIWKAKHFLDTGRIDDAEKTIRAAIAIDPSDGEQGKGDRMRAYAILADVLEKKGDADTAKIFRGAVKAVRLSEDADDWWQAGLLTRALGMYEDSLKHFADAYCIQSRLALRYSEVGDLEKAEKHYQRAFELMPDSFGRVESHCFGCEGIFSGTTSQNVAERVFTKLAKEKPDQPQVHYLLGYLRENQKRYPEAATAFRRAVELDPEYVNAWKKLDEIADKIDMPEDERNRIAFALFRLSHDSDALDNVSDLPQAWSLILHAEATLPKPLSGPLYPLAASATALKAEQTQTRRGRSNYYHYSMASADSDDESLRSEFMDNKILSQTKSLMERLLTRD
jgi:tetratricopeptide (TPR) repeat protein